MGVKSSLAKVYAKVAVRDMYRMAKRAVDCQDIIFDELIQFSKDSYFGKAHNFAEIKTIADYQARVPIRDYEEAKLYFDLTAEGKRNILWPGRPLYFAKTSGTTSGSKFIPITQESISNHMNGARSALLANIWHTKSTKFVNGKMIFLSGSPELYDHNGIKTGRLSGIVNHHIPNYLKKNQVPSWETNCIEDWEEKVDAIVSETMNIDMTLISGIPPWVLMYFERLLERTGKTTIKEVFPNFEVFVYGGVNYEPYRAKIDRLIGGKVQMIETYPASEGFIAFQDKPDVEGLLLNSNSGIFFEFVPADEIFNENPTRLSLRDVELDKNYAILLTSNAGLWSYNIGDTVKFVSTDPHRIVVTGRIKHFISAFGEHVIGEEVEKSLQQGIKAAGGEIVEFHVAPKIKVEEGLPYHEWLIAFERLPKDMEVFATEIDKNLQEFNSYYKDLRQGNMLRELVVTSLPADAFRTYMKRKGKLGGQNKVPRLSNDRSVADELI